jgi:hypothetical protein
MQFELRFYQHIDLDLAKGLSRRLGVELVETYFQGRDINDLISVIMWSHPIFVSKHTKNVISYSILFNDLESIYKHNLQDVFKDTNSVSVQSPEGFLVPFIKTRHIINRETGISTQLEYYVNDTELIEYWVSLGCPSKIQVNYEVIF